MAVFSLPWAARVPQLLRWLSRALRRRVDLCLQRLRLGGLPLPIRHPLGVAARRLLGGRDRVAVL
jgi:hypothetical protein